VKSLSHRIRAELFLQLSRLERSGIAYDRAVAMVALPSSAAPRLKSFQALAARGTDAARAGEQSGLFTPLESRLVRAALNSGSPAPTYQRLAEHHAQRARQSAAMKSRLLLPAFVLGIALFIQPLPSLVSGAIGLAGYAWQVIAPLMAIAAILVVLAFVREWLPIYRPIFIRTNLRDFFESLAQMLEAGVPMFDALPPAIDTVSDRGIRRELGVVRQAVQKGKTFGDALDGVSYLQGSAALALAHTGEQSGTLPEMLTRYAAMETEAITHFHEQLATWLPRIVYALVAIKVVMGIFAGGGMAPRVPPQL
jgi:type II secretory pathway component PulF